MNKIRKALLGSILLIVMAFSLNLSVSAEPEYAVILGQESKNQGSSIINFLTKKNVFEPGERTKYKPFPNGHIVDYAFPRSPNFGVFESSIKKVTDGIYMINTVIFGSSRYNNFYVTYLVKYKDQKYYPYEISTENKTLYKRTTSIIEDEWLSIRSNSSEDLLYNHIGSVGGWTYLGKDASGDEYFIDKNKTKYKYSGKMANITLKKIHSNAADKFAPKYEVIEKGLDCTTGKMKTTSLYQFTSDLGVIYHNGIFSKAKGYPHEGLEKELFGAVCKPAENKDYFVFNPDKPQVESSNANDFKFVKDYDDYYVINLHRTAQKAHKNIYYYWKGIYKNKHPKTLDSIKYESGTFDLKIAVNLNKDGIINEIKLLKGFKNPSYDKYALQLPSLLNDLEYSSSLRTKFDIDGIDNVWIVLPINQMLPSNSI